MDGVLSTLLSASPQIGVGSFLVFVLSLLIRRESQALTGHRNDIAALTARHTAELHRINTDHDSELDELRREISGQRAQLDDLNRKLDAERDRRRDAEDRRPRWGGPPSQGAQP